MSARVLVTGAHGFVGRATVEALRRAEYSDLLAPPRAELDLERREETLAYFDRHRPEFVVHLAGKVGGIAANIADPVGFLASNAAMGLHLLEACHRVRARKTVLLGSSCMYPRACPQPMREDMLMTGPLEPTNEGYALAKIQTLKLGQAYRTQFGLGVACVIPSNVYGPGDHFDLARGHVLAALVKRFVDARRTKLTRVMVWGTGAARREFVHIDDLARALVFVLARVDSAEPINVGPGVDVSIRELAVMIAGKVGYAGEIAWDPAKPDGMPRKCMDVGRARDLGFVTSVELADGLDGVIAAYEGGLT